MSFKRNNMDDDDDNDNNDDGRPFAKRQRFDNDDFRGRGRGRGRDFRGRGRGDRGGRGRGGFNRGGDDSDFRGRGSFLGGRGRGHGRDRGGFRGRGFGGRDGGGGFDRFERETFIKVGQVAPSFENIMNDKSELTSLKQYQGKYVALFIYFKDGTFGCSEEQKAFRDAKNDFDKHNAVIIGVSQDDVASHQQAIEELNLNYTLLADTDTAITKAYGAIDNGRVTRSTFLISPDGKVAAVWGKVFGFDKHPKEVARKLEEIANGKSGDNESKNENEESGNENENENENEEDDDVNEDANEANDDDNADEDNDGNDDDE